MQLTGLQKQQTLCAMLGRKPGARELARRFEPGSRCLEVAAFARDGRKTEKRDQLILGVVLLSGLATYLRKVVLRLIELMQYQRCLRVIHAQHVVRIPIGTQGLADAKGRFEQARCADGCSAPRISEPSNPSSNRQSSKAAPADSTGTPLPSYRQSRIATPTRRCGSNLRAGWCIGLRRS